ncbi:minor capsid protein [Alkalicoccobacillus gibsonii]|uniref:minor capsid protein n=1 Tax=Alkalicoccobacillus gibsonii TaxID=79881 RepID=UPI003F7B3B24
MKVSFNGVKNKVSSTAIKKGRFAAANQMLVDMNQFVPKQEGILRGTGQVTNNSRGMIWDMPYGARLFYMPMYNYSEPGTGPRWDLKAKGMFMSDWMKVFARGAGW